MMKLRQLEIVLQDVEPFHTPKLWLEQYTTPPHLAGKHRKCNRTWARVQDQMVKK